MLHWTIWGKEPGVHEASLRRYGSKLDKMNVSFRFLQQLLKMMATNLNASMTSVYKILPHHDKYPWCVLDNIIDSYYSGN